MNLFNSGYILSNKRFGWIDYDRGISIILVTYRHCYEGMENSGMKMHDYPILEYLNYFLFGFRMPLFFIASGIFVGGSLRKRGLGAYSKNRVQTILYPLLVWGIIQISLQILFSAHTNSSMSVRNYLDLLIDPRTTGQFWYLNALFCVGILYSFLKVKAKMQLWHQILLGLALYFFGAYLRTTPVYIGFAMDICKFYFFFALGDAVSGYIMSEKAAKTFTSWKFVVPMLIAFFSIQYIFTDINLDRGSDYFVENNMPFFFLLVAVVGCTVSMIVSFSLKRYQAAPFLRVVGYNSVHIYCMQIIAMSVTRLFLTKILHVENIPIIFGISLLCGVMIPMIFYNICLRLNMWWLFTLKKPEEEINYLSSMKTSNA